jgi:predicted component of viral defense system (DUF524 family)
MAKRTDTTIEFRSPSGAVIAHVVLTPLRRATRDDTAPLLEITVEEASEHGETIVQLRESERYEYKVDPVTSTNSDLRLRLGKNLATRWPSLRQNGTPDGGLIETKSFCGTLLMELVEGDASDLSKTPVASALIDVRSLKLEYRTEYRGMLRRLSKEMADLVADARSSAKAGFRSTFEDRRDAGWLQIQLELLRETLDSANFSAAIQRILSFPHERLSTVRDSISTDRPIRWTPSAVRQLVTGNPRREVPASHPLRTRHGIGSVAERVSIPRRSRDLDTPENRFVKFALSEFLSFLTHAQGVFDSTRGWGASEALARRLAGTVEDWLSRSLFREIGEMRFAPLGSPVLQRKAGYRELLRWWLQFRTAAELSWDGGEEIFHAGQRDVASLYEYWLFFELLEWFCQKCRGGTRPPLEDLIEGFENGSPNLRLRKRFELGPFTGTFAGQSRRLQARFSYNRRFEVTRDRHAGGSWTRRLHPDYTMTFWPDDLSEEAAEREELLVHVHFDAKYRVENIEGLFGPSDDGVSEEELAERFEQEEKEELDGNYKRQDLLKMHAYRDAIKRSQGAYVLYPGRGNAAEMMMGFHEILPGLGAFGVAPDENGEAQGLESLEKFLDEVLAHLGNRTTAQERVSFHIAESYKVQEPPVTYGSLVLPERDVLSDTGRALPPAEHHVVVAWYDSPEQLDWTLQEGIANVRLGKRKGTWHIPPEMASAVHVLLRTHKYAVAPGLFKLKTPGYKVYTADDLKAKNYPGSAKGEIYAVFEVEADDSYAAVNWNAQEIVKVLRNFEERRSYRKISDRELADPRVVSLQDLLRAMK